MSYEYHPDGRVPDTSHIWVYGSNLAGRHGKGAALVALKRFGARYGTGRGRVDMSYGIVTKDGNLKTLPLSEIKLQVEKFKEYAWRKAGVKFFVTRVGCGLAGYKDEEIAPMFKDSPVTCIFPEQWKVFLE